MSPPENDERTDPGFDEARLYVVIRDAVEDAIMGVLGTLMLLGVSAVLVWSGGAMAVGRLDLTGVAVGIVLVAAGMYLGAATLGIVPPAREWV